MRPGVAPQCQASGSPGLLGKLCSLTLTRDSEGRAGLRALPEASLRTSQAAAGVAFSAQIQVT